jgi:hypothetical protein
MPTVYCRSFDQTRTVKSINEELRSYADMLAGPEPDDELEKPRLWFDVVSLEEHVIVRSGTTEYELKPTISKESLISTSGDCFILGKRSRTLLCEESNAVAAGTY